MLYRIQGENCRKEEKHAQQFYRLSRFHTMKQTKGRGYAMDAFYHAAAQLPRAIAQPLSAIPEKIAQCVTEIRLRSGRPVVLSIPNGVYFVRQNGTVAQRTEANLLTVSHDAMQGCFQALCGYSVHSFTDSIANGFVPLPGGHRAGICGTAYTDSDGVFMLKNITSINLRIARTKAFAPDARLTALLHADTVGLIVAGAPGSGKTTLLRTAMTELSRMGKNVAVVDERCEIAPVGPTGFYEKIPLHCDVLSGYPRHIGMQHALRTLAPDVLICDEVGALSEMEAIVQAANAGVGLVVTIHARDRETLRRRPQYTALLRTGAFSKVAFLAGRQRPGSISEVYHVETAV